MRFPDDLPDFPEASEPDDDASLDADFPLGDGTVDTDAAVICPYCGETVTILLDAGGGSVQQYIEDCGVCCQPWQVSVTFRGGEASVSVRPLED